MSIFKKLGQLSLAATLLSVTFSTVNVNASPLSFGKLYIPVPETRQSAPTDLMPWLFWQPNRFMPTTESTLAPFAFVKLCITNSLICESKGPNLLPLDRKTRHLISSVNTSVNNTIKPRHDTGDVWTVGALAGDCEDYALTKKQKLIELGFPSSALRMAVAKTPKGEGHAVLVLTTDRGDMILDNRTNKILPWKKSDLSWVKIQSKNNPMLWKTIEV